MTMRIPKTSPIVLALSFSLSFFQLPSAQKSLAQAPQADESAIYGSHIMTGEERADYLDRMRQATTAEERECVRLDHRYQMQARAKQSGAALYDETPAAPARRDRKNKAVTGNHAHHQ
jgi:hypothetical protein